MKVCIAVASKHGVIVVLGSTNAYQL